MKNTVLLIALMLTLSSISCKETTQDTVVLTKEVKFTKEGTLSIKKASTDSLVATLDIEFAETEYETQTGLMYRKSMLPNRGMLFIFESEAPKAFYMKNTEFSLDIIYLNAQKEIVTIQKNAKPLDETSLPSGIPAQYVLEVNAGLSDQWGLESGDRIEYSKD